MSLVRFLNASDETIYVLIESDVKIAVSESNSESDSTATENHWKIVQPKIKIKMIEGGGASFEKGNKYSKTHAEQHSADYFVERGPKAGARMFLPYNAFEMTIPYEGVKTFYVTLFDKNINPLRGLERLAFDTAQQSNLVYHGDTQQILKAEPEKSALLTNASGIVLKFGDQMLGRPITKKSWPASSFAKSGHTHFIHCRNQVIVSGSTVRITSNSSKEGYVYLYSSAKGWIYYDQQSEDQKQFWIVEKMDGTTGDEIRSGDKIQLRNAYYSDSYLRKYSDVYPSCEANSEGSEIVVEVQSQG